MTKVFSLLRDALKANRLFLLVLVLKALGGASSFLFVFYITRQFGIATTGLFTTSYALMMGVSIISRFGMGGSLMFYIPRLKGKVLSLFLFSSVLILILFLFCVALVTIFEKQYLLQYFDLFLFLALPFTMIYLCSCCFRAFGRPVFSTLFDPGIVYCLSVILIWVFTLINNNYSTEYIVWGYGSVLTLFALLGFFLLARADWTLVKLEYPLVREFISKSSNFFLINFGALVQSVFIVLIGGIYLSSEQIGAYKVLLQLGLIVSFTLIVVETIYARKYAEAFHESNIVKLKEDFRKARISSLAISLPISFLLLFADDYLLHYLGLENYENSKAILWAFIISFQISNYFNVSVSLLGMTGFDKGLRNIVISINCIGLAILCLFLVVYEMGVLSMVLSMIFIVLAQSILSYVYAKKKVFGYNYGKAL